MSRNPHEKGGPPPEMLNLTPKEKALEILFSEWTAKASIETVNTTSAVGRILAEDVFSLYNVPIVRASAMDGVALKFDCVKDGTPDTASWVRGVDYVRADTGDDFDDAFDTVVQIEKVAVLENGGLRFEDGIEFKRGSNVNGCGSSVKQGELLAKSRTRLNCLDISAILSGGISEIKVLRKPKIAFIPTGSELVAPGSDLKRGQRYDANSTMAGLLISEMGAEAEMHPIVKDDKAAIQKAMESVLASCDIIILNAGTSKGDEDYSRTILEQGKMLFSGVAAVPGRPMSASMINGKPVINMSGPTMAAFYSFEWLIKPMVSAFFGITVPAHEEIEVILKKPLGFPPFLSPLTRLHVTQGRDGKYYGTPLQMRGPDATPQMEMMVSNAMYAPPFGSTPFEEGDKVIVQLLRTRDTIRKE